MWKAFIAAAFCLLACGVLGERSEVYDVIGERCCSSGACYPGQTDMAELNRKLTGRIVLPYMAEYANRSHMYNTIEQRFPSMIVMAKTRDDIRFAILFAREFNLHVTIMSSGHDFFGRSTWEGSFLINLSEMDEMHVDLSTDRSPDGTLTTQTGVTWAEIYQELESHKRVFVGGSAHTVAPGGYTLGGGHSPVSRSLGYAVDNVLEIQVVLADGSVATCTKNRTVIEHVDGQFQYVEDGDLFWAQLGGGGGTFGVTVYFVFRLHPMPSQMVVMTTSIPFEMPTLSANLFEAAMSQVHILLETLPREWGGYWLSNNYPGVFSKEDTGLPDDLPYKGMLTLFLNKFAPWDGTELTAFQSLRDFATANNIPVTFSNRTGFWDYEKDAKDPPITRAYLAGTLLPLEKIDETLLGLVSDMYFKSGKDMWLSCTGIMVGGKTTEFSLESTPLHPGYRSAVTSLGCGVALADTSQPLLDQTAYNDVMINYFDGVGLKLRTHGYGMYSNEGWKNNPYWKEDFWGPNYDRLLKIKLRYDPDNFFTCHHCVGSDLSKKNDDRPEDVTSSAPTIHVMMSFLSLLFCLIL